jgi:hypothetical protein
MAAPLGFKTFNTGDVLSAADTNGFLMQGVLVFADAAARSAAITSPQEGQTSYLKDTDVIQVYSGSAWVTKSGGSSPLTTKGDLYTYSTTDARLPVGTNGHTLVADSAEATGLKWAAAAAGGKVLQVVSATTTTSTTISTTTYTDTTLTASITPSSATSKILVLVTQMWYFNRTGIVIYPKGQIVRGASSIYENTFLGGFGVPNATGLIESFGVWSPSYLDSPSTTSSTTYKTQMARQGLASGDLIVNFGSVTASIILLEIGA